MRWKVGPWTDRTRPAPSWTAVEGVGLQEVLADLEQAWGARNPKNGAVLPWASPCRCSPGRFSLSPHLLSPPGSAQACGVTKSRTAADICLAAAAAPLQHLPGE